MIDMAYDTFLLIARYKLEMAQVLLIIEAKYEEIK
jgi:uncharacterized protein YciU (UPF0263 family)